MPVVFGAQGVTVNVARQISLQRAKQLASRRHSIPPSLARHCGGLHEER